MNARKNSGSPRAPARGKPRLDIPPPIPAWIVEFSKFIEEFRKLIDSFRNEGIRASKRGHRTEAAILFHVASRLPAMFTAPLDEVGKDVAKLLSYFPPTKIFRNATLIERKAMLISGILRQGFNNETKTDLTKRATQAPGRPPEAQQYAALARDLHGKGLTWREIAKRLLPDLSDERKGARTINREVQLLNAALRRYGVKV